MGQDSATGQDRHTTKFRVLQCFRQLRDFVTRERLVRLVLNITILVAQGWKDGGDQGAVFLRNCG